MFSVGDRVVHPLHGAGIIEEITQERMSGQVGQYYVFRMPTGGLTLKVPTANCGAVGLRGLLSREKMEELLRAIPALDAEMTNNWNRRYRENMEKLKSGNLLEVARVIKGLALREEKHGLSTGERKMLHNAKQVLLSELVFVRELTYEEAEALLQDVIMEN